jgi:hypothetical protein
MLNDLYQEALEVLFNDNKEPPTEAVVLKVYPQNQTAGELKEGEQQFQSAVLRVPGLHDCIPDPVRLVKNSTNGEVNNSIQIHGVYFSKEPLASVDGAESESVLLQVGHVVPIEYIDGVIRFGIPKSKNTDYAKLQFISEKAEDQGLSVNEQELQTKFEGREVVAIEDFVGPLAPDQDTNIQTAIYVKTETIVENGNIPMTFLKKWDAQDKEILGGGDVLLLEDVFDSFLLLAQDFKNHFGYNLPVTDSYRSYQEQVVVKEIKTREGKPHEAATPGTSNHGWGIAFDYNTKRKLKDGTYGDGGHSGAHYKWLFVNAPKRGFHSPPWAQKGGSSPEAWHFEWIKKDEIIKIQNKKVAKNESE